jgi:hypothetical protein
MDISTFEDETTRLGETSGTKCQWRYAASQKNGDLNYTAAKA